MVDDMGANLDLYATFASITSGSEPTSETGYISKDLSGVLLRNEDGPRNNWFYCSGAIAYRSGKYKIHLSTKDRSSNPDTREREPIKQHDPPLLFDLTNDIGEQHNINAEHPEVVDRLLKELNAYRN